MDYVIVFLIIIVVVFVPSSRGFIRVTRLHFFSCRGIAFGKTTTTTATKLQSCRERRFYEYDGVSCSYEYQRSCCGDTKNNNRNSPTRCITSKVLLIHPVGIGLCNWFWDKFIMAVDEQASVKNDNNDQTPTTTKIALDLYAINLIGCGQSRQSGTVDDGYYVAAKAHNLDLLLPWTRQCVFFIDEVMRKDYNDVVASSMKNHRNNNDTTPITVISQGGLATIVLQLAMLRPKIISTVILASPPTLQQLQNGLNVEKAYCNWEQLRQLPPFVFSHLLETKWAIRFFSNLFLFQDACDETWLENATTESNPSVRPAVRYFNAGMCEIPIWKPTVMASSSQRFLMVRGAADRRMADPLLEEMSNGGDRVCVKIIPNANKVVPWEAPYEFLAAVQSFLQTVE